MKQQEEDEAAEEDNRPPDGLLARGVRAPRTQAALPAALPFIASRSAVVRGACHHHQGYDSMWVLAVGIDTYASGTGLAQLHGAEADAAAVADLFRARGARVTTLLGQRATTDEIGRALRERQALPGPRDLLVVYFSGHGRLVTADRDATVGAICLHNYDGRGAGEMLMTHLRDFVSASRAGHKLVIFDCCYPGHGLLQADGDRERRQLTRPWNAFVARPTSQVLAAAAADGYAYEVAESGRPRGIFTRHLIDGLNGQAFEQRGGGREWITLAELAEWVGEKVARTTDSKQRVQHGFPVGVRPEEQGQVIFVRPGAELDRDCDDWVFLCCDAVADEEQIVGAPPPPPAAAVVVSDQQETSLSSPSPTWRDRMMNVIQVSSSVIVAVEVVCLGLYLAKRAWDSHASNKHEPKAKDDGAGGQDQDGAQEEADDDSEVELEEV